MQPPATDFDANVAAAIAAGMRDVAMADGSMHQRELSLISAFEGEIPAGTEAADLSALTDEAVRTTYLKSLVMVALADGVISDSESTVLATRAAAVGVDADGLEALTNEVKREFLATFSNVRIFADSVKEIAESLGLES